MNKKIKGLRETSTADLAAAEGLVLSAKLKSQQCFWPDIVSNAAGRCSAEELLQASRSLQSKGLIRLKECNYDHAMEYIATPAAQNP